MDIDVIERLVRECPAEDVQYTGLRRILIASDERMFRLCLAHWLDGANFSCHCASCFDDPFLDPFSRDADVILIDHSQCAVETVLRLISEVRHHLQKCRVLIMGNKESERELVRFIEAGAVGFVSKDQSPQELINTIESVFQYDADCTPAQASAVFARLQQLSRERDFVPSFSTSDLTSRELEILKQIDLGRSNKEIARELHVSIHTVKTHVHHILEKAGAANRRRAVYLAYKNGWLA